MSDIQNERPDAAASRSSPREDPGIALLTSASGDMSIGEILRRIKGYFTKHLPAAPKSRGASESTSYDGSGSPSPVVTRLPDGTFRVEDAEGNEIGTALDADGVQRFVEAAKKKQEARIAKDEISTDPDADLDEAVSNASARPTDAAQDRDMPPYQDSVRTDEQAAKEETAMADDGESSLSSQADVEPSERHSDQELATDDDFFDELDDDGDVIHERRSKHRKREKDGQKKDKAEARGILANVRKLASNWMTNEQHEQQPRRKMLFATKVTATPEERMILKSRYEIMLVYSRHGRLKSAHGGSREQSKIPVFSPGDILSHNHPRGRGPSDTDIKLALDHPDITLRIVAKNENGATEIFQLRAKRPIGKSEISRIIRVYAGVCDAGGDNHASRRRALNLISKRFGDSIDIIRTAQ